jgi:hypothetical protein
MKLQLVKLTVVPKKPRFTMYDRNGRLIVEDLRMKPRHKIDEKV